MCRALRPLSATIAYQTRAFRFTPANNLSFSSLQFEPIHEKLLNDPLDETAWSALAKSCYASIDWKISEDATVQEAVSRMAVHKIGALAVTKADGNGEICGIISERDYLNKIGVLGRDGKTTKIGEICTYGRANLISVTLGNPIDKCMKKLLNSNTRHLLVQEADTGSFVGMISIKDVVKCNLYKHEAMINKLTGYVVNSNPVN